MKNKKLTEVDYKRMWGNDIPYSQVNLIEQSRVLGNGISRVFLVVEIEINPFTFEYALVNKDRFKNDPAIQQLLSHAHFRGPIEGYVVMAGEEELIDKESFNVAFSYRKIALESIIKLHDLVINDFGLKKSASGTIKIKDIISGDNKNSKNKKYIWNERTGNTVPVNSADDELWDDESSVESPAGSKDGKIRYFIVFALAADENLNRKDLHWSSLQIKTAARKYKVKIERVDAGHGYIMFTVLIAPNIVPLDFIEACIENTNLKSDLFKKDHFITNIARPTGNEIIDFLENAE